MDLDALEEDKQIDTTNRFLVTLQGNDVLFLRSVPQRISRIDAINLAAWIVAICPEKNFSATLKAVQNT